MKLGFLPKRQLLPEQYLKLSPGSEQTWLTDPFKKERSRTVVHELAKNVLTAGFNPDLIVGDDASGHLPTLVIGSILRERARITNATMPVIRFMSGEVARNAHLDKSFFWARRSSNTHNYRIYIFWQSHRKYLGLITS